MADFVGLCHVYGFFKGLRIARFHSLFKFFGSLHPSLFLKEDSCSKWIARCHFPGFLVLSNASSWPASSAGLGINKNIINRIALKYCKPAESRNMRKDEN